MSVSGTYAHKKRTGTAGEYRSLLTGVFSYANEIFLSEKTAGGYRPESITLSRIPAGIHPANLKNPDFGKRQCGNLFRF